MRDKRPLIVVAAVAVVAVALGVAFALGAFRSDEDRAREAVDDLMASYVVPEADEDGEEPEDGAWPADDFGDADTMGVLMAYGVDPEEWHRHCMANLSYQVGDVTAEGDSATASVTMTNASLSAAIDAAGADLTAYAQTQEAEDVYAQGGRAALFSHLVDSLYAHLDANESPVTSTVSVSLSKGDDGTWTPQVAGDEAFFSALYGGSDVIAGLAAAGDAAGEGE